MVNLDLLLTDSFLMYGFHLSSGRLNPETVHSEWHIETAEEDLVKILQDALVSHRVRESLTDLLPQHHCYRSLRDIHDHYRGIAEDGGWPSIPEGVTLRKGDRGERVRALRQRLTNSGSIVDEDAKGSELYDGELESAVKTFQRLHGLEEDGIVGKRTLTALNVPVEDRIRQVEINMERWRWLPRELGQRYIVVNIANYLLDIFENDKSVLSMRVVVGRDYRKTPVFNDRMTYLVFNPTWMIPTSITVEDILPLIQENPGYLSKNNMKVFASWASDAEEIKPDEINWSSASEENFEYRLKQDPGPSNALGRIKFMFPNRFNVYLHDTPARHLFSETVRAFSSGCIRLEQPLDLAEYLLGEDSEWSRDKIQRTLDDSKEWTVQIPEPIPIYILYCTAWSDEHGNISFSNDIYKRDDLVDAALEELPPTPKEWGKVPACGDAVNMVYMLDDIPQ
jgi:murein L,D-transpeptidase YcbB/YkuD